MRIVGSAFLLALLPGCYMLAGLTPSQASLVEHMAVVNDTELDGGELTRLGYEYEKVYETWIGGHNPFDGVPADIAWEARWKVYEELGADVDLVCISSGRVTNVSISNGHVFRNAPVRVQAYRHIPIEDQKQPQAVLFGDGFREVDTRETLLPPFIR